MCQPVADRARTTLQKHATLLWPVWPNMGTLTDQAQLDLWAGWLQSPFMEAAYAAHVFLAVLVPSMINMALLKLAAQRQLPGSCPIAINCAVHPCCLPQQYTAPAGLLR